MRQTKKVRQTAHLTAATPTPRTRALTILYISVTAQRAQPYLDPSTRYRCFYPVEAARALGHRAFVATQDAMDLDPALFDMVVVHRPSFTPSLVRFLRKARAATCRLIADYDDLTFDPRYAMDSTMFRKLWDTAAVHATFERNTDALHLFDEFTVSTAPLRDNVLALHPGATVHVIPNSISPTLWSMIAQRDYQAQHERPYLGYFPGTATHDEDFQVAAQGVAQFCRDRSVSLRIIGPINTDHAIFHGVDVQRLALQPYNDMFDSLSLCRVVLAPLTPTQFNRAKSHIKLVEASLSCTSCVASAIPDMARHHALTGAGTLVDGNADWSGAIHHSWDSFTLQGASAAREALVSRFGAVEVCRPLFAPLAVPLVPPLVTEPA